MESTRAVQHVIFDTISYIYYLQICNYRPRVDPRFHLRADGMRKMALSDSTIFIHSAQG